jgi:hypothetical protein
MLLDRDAIPEIRLRWFKDEKLNPGGNRKSRLQWIEEDGQRGDDVFALGNFPDYLWYFVNGPDLPARTIERFCSVVNDSTTTKSGMMDLLGSFVRREIREQRLSHYSVADEFYKVAIETDQEKFASKIRQAAISVR